MRDMLAVHDGIIVRIIDPNVNKWYGESRYLATCSCGWRSEVPDGWKHREFAVSDLQEHIEQAQPVDCPLCGQLSAPCQCGYLQ